MTGEKDFDAWAYRPAYRWRTDLGYYVTTEDLVKDPKTAAHIESTKNSWYYDKENEAWCLYRTVKPVFKAWWEDPQNGAV